MVESEARLGLVVVLPGAGYQECQPGMHQLGEHLGGKIKLNRRLGRCQFSQLIRWA